MTAQKFIEERVKAKFREKATVLALLENGRGFWHVHRDEEVPSDRPVSVRIRLNK